MPSGRRSSSARTGTFTPIDDMVGGGPFRLAAGEWTDDTSMALCLAESILDTGAMDLDDQLRRYLLWKDDGYLSSKGRCFDIGITTRTQLERYRRTGQAVDPRRMRTQPPTAHSCALLRYRSGGTPIPPRRRRDRRSPAARRTLPGDQLMLAV